MKRAELMKRLRKLAKATDVELTFVREGANHELWEFGSFRCVIPRHTEINEITANGILKACEESER